MFKLVIFTCNALLKINDSCLQFWGGMGFTNDVEISRSYRWKKIYWKIFFENLLKHRKFLLLPKLNLREGSRYQIGWIFGKFQIAFDHPPSFLEKYVANFYNEYGCIYARRYASQIVWNAYICLLQSVSCFDFSQYNCWKNIPWTLY